jgi:lipid II:glycine glycyltransferase (peptidoglycan interpeptide bridge formation enzyme)
MIQGTECTDKTAWDDVVCELGGHPLQLWGWGALKAAHNWRVHRVLFQSGDGEAIGAAQILLRALPASMGDIAYIPRGPVAHNSETEHVYDALIDYAKRNFNAIVLTVEPDDIEGPKGQGWKQSHNTVLIPHTLILDLAKSDDELLVAMTKKTRQYIRKSGKEQLSIRQVKSRDELQQCLAIYHETAARAGFALHGDQYYYDVAELLDDSSVVFAAFEHDNPIAFLWLAVSQKTSFELYGGMNDRGQTLRANYALKWHAIQRCKEWGIERYDMNGLLNDGVSTFKRGFAAHEDMLAGTYDYALSPLYAVWSKGLPLVKKTVRTINKLRK